MSKPKLEIITLVENLAYQQGTKGEHGLAFVVRTGGKQILFDTGQSGLLIENARRMNIDLSTIDAVVISHGHYDHTGGLAAFFSVNNHAPVFLKSRVFDEKLSKSTGNLRFIGIDREVVDANRKRFQLVQEATEVAPGLMVVPNIGKYYDFEQPSQTMMVKTGDEIGVDLFEDELFMLYDSPEGLTVFTGCAHRGIGNICRTAMVLTGNKNIRLVLGGTHLKGASLKRIHKTVEAFEDMEVSRFGLCHCTGLPAFIEFSTTFGEKVRYAHVGTRFLPYD
jgi:7,8-dihydropterin-6-yl-methyl-4-(beta-D-ribofuranosyl)aminobenzene 5'-phosphate synthase